MMKIDGCNHPFYNVTHYGRGYYGAAAAARFVEALESYDGESTFQLAYSSPSDAAQTLAENALGFGDVFYKQSSCNSTPAEKIAAITRLKDGMEGYLRWYADSVGVFQPNIYRSIQVYIQQKKACFALEKLEQPTLDLSSALDGKVSDFEGSLYLNLSEVLEEEEALPVLQNEALHDLNRLTPGGTTAFFKEKNQLAFRMLPD